MTELMLRGISLGKYKGIVLDKDGTITSSEEFLFNKVQIRVKEALRIYKGKRLSGPKMKKLEQYLLAAFGVSRNSLSPEGSSAIASYEQNLITTATVLSLLGENWSNSIMIATEIFQNSDYIFSKSLDNKNKAELLPGILNFLQQCKSHQLACSIISNDSNHNIQAFINKNQLQESIQFIWGAGNYHSKPDPLCIKELCLALNLDPSECVLISDSDTDLRMGKQAGLGLVLGYTAGWSQPPRLSEYQHLIHHWDELSLSQDRNL